MIVSPPPLLSLERRLHPFEVFSVPGTATRGARAHFAVILAGGGGFLGSILALRLISQRGIGGPAALSSAGILAGARIFLLRLGGVALRILRIWIEWRCVQTAHCAAQQAGEGSCQD